MRKEFKNGLFVAGCLASLAFSIIGVVKYPCNVELDRGMSVEECRAHSEEAATITQIGKEAEEWKREHPEGDSEIVAYVDENSSDIKIKKEASSEDVDNVEESGSVVNGVTTVETEGEEIKKTSDFKGISYAEYMSKEGGRQEILNNSILGDYGVRYSEGRPLISLNSLYGGNIGDAVTVKFDNGRSLTCVIADVKGDDGSAMNIICNKGYVPDKVLKTGTFSSVDVFAGKVVEVMFE